MKKLFLEERIAIVYRALNIGSLPFQDRMDANERILFKQYVLDMMSVLSGFDDGSLERINKACEQKPEKKDT